MYALLEQEFSSMSSDQSAVLCSVSEGVATVTLNRPAVLNALNNAMGEALLSTLTALAEDDTIRVVVLCGAGDAFMAGGDVGFFQDLLKSTGDRQRLRVVVTRTIDCVQQAVRIIRSMPKPVIAAVHGGCAGFGLSLMLAADLAVVADNTKFTLAYIHLATTPDGGASFYLPRIVGQKRAAEIAFLGDRFGAAEAEKWGMVNRVVPLTELPEATVKLAARLARGPVLAYARTKTLLNASAGNSLDTQLAAEAESFAASALTEDFAAAVAAFLAKTQPKFAGR
jgi:2-(1,2-epoxy-1,2-dihydrophenyl)acetyl-CoA isomerase